MYKEQEEAFLRNLLHLEFLKFKPRKGPGSETGCVLVKEHPKPLVEFMNGMLALLFGPLWPPQQKDVQYLQTIKVKAYQTGGKRIIIQLVIYSERIKINHDEWAGAQTLCGPTLWSSLALPISGFNFLPPTRPQSRGPAQRHPSQFLLSCNLSIPHHRGCTRSHHPRGWYSSS